MTGFGEFPSGRRVVVTGIGVISSLGTDAATVEEALRTGRSGITFAPEYAERGFRSQVHGMPDVDLAERIDKRQLRFMGDGAAYAYLAMEQAIADSGLEPGEVSHERTGLIAGSGGPSTANLHAAFQTVIEKGSPKRMGPFMVTRGMSSTVSACLATPFAIKGLNYSITSACSTSLHCIGNAVEQIQMGKQDVIFAGGGEEVHWTLSSLFDAMGAMSSKFNDRPTEASRPFDAARDGFVISGGGGMLVLEELKRARARGATIYGEITGYGATSDGADMVAPSGEGGARAMAEAVRHLGDRTVTYVNAHGTGTPVGDVPEMEAIRQVLGEDHAPVASSKSLAGHSQGATGALEAIYCLLMMRGGFLQGSANVDELDPAFREGEVLTETREAEIDTILTNSFGFGGTNASLALSKMRS